MNTYMNATTLNKVNEAIAKFNRMASKCDTVICKKFDLLRHMLERDCESILTDVKAAERLGYISHDEWVGIYGDIERMRLAAVGAFRTAEKERIGEREYVIRYDVYAYGYTREEAEKAYDEDWE
ncbi:MAG: hypothetical protein II013_07360 [Lachnobacterium sp.]|nr:hypothetical protein [Lachnobacterium sp.]